MGDTCPICGRPNAGVWDGPDPKKCFQQLGDDCETCWRLGYEREKEQAQVSEDGFATARLTIAEMVAEKVALEAALAAARRAESAAKEAHAYCLHMFSREWLTDPKNRSIFAAQIFRTLEAVLAAPAAGEEGKHG